MAEKVILVSADDKETGTMDKMLAHQLGALHRAFSVFIFNSAGALLLQQRAEGKYHSAKKWTNSCCSHPRPGEMVMDAANRRLNEEMGMTCNLTQIFTFSYHAKLEDGLIENEFDYVLFGMSNQLPVPNPNEVMDFKYVDIDNLSNDLQTNPGQYTAWLKICFDCVKEHHREYFKP